MKNEIKASDTAVGVKIKDAFLLAVVVIVSTFGNKVLDLLSKAEAAGRPKGTTKDVVRKSRTLRAFDEEWKMLKEFASIVKKDPERAKSLLK